MLENLRNNGKGFSSVRMRGIILSVQTKSQLCLAPTNATQAEMNQVRTKPFLDILLYLLSNLLFGELKRKTYRNRAIEEIRSIALLINIWALTASKRCRFGLHQRPLRLR